MRGATAIPVLAILAHDVSCYRVQISELGGVKINNTLDHMKVVMLHEEPGTQNSWAGVYRNISGSGGNATIEQPGAMGGPDNVSMYFFEDPGTRVNATVDGDTIKYYQRVQPTARGLKFTRSNGVVKSSDGSTWERDEAGTQNSWTGVYRNVSGSRGTAMVLQPGVMERPINASIYLSEAPSIRLNATVDGDTMTVYHRVEVFAPPIKSTRSNGVIKSFDGSTLLKEDDTMAHNGEVDFHDGFDEHIEEQAAMDDLEGNWSGFDNVDEQM